ncbi:phage holin family protein [Peptostreptococcus anaerobius]|uniref:phage holin family protein n=1 Tax=Peptostreptococcus anaerobius TaxID=1261 RepID=UPI00290082D1|nr:phage holin family protein [Peptostreptococcus anaerobius]MDU1174216.1 phage holin family protein [Peptostreptococcus anaerobius]MDU1232726.1 phage holin family protein [Peptostreptococcus anaerobius]MDU5096964.1 phage holin family protein [Peptostreptococcus anaerobius]
MSEKLIDNIKIILCTCGGLIGIIFGGWDKTFQVLIIFITIDYLSGIAASICNHKLDSHIGFKGISKKISILMILAVAVQIDRLMDINSQVVRMTTCFFYIANEGLSILENGNKLGVKYPQILKNVLKEMKKNDLHK